MQTATMPRPMRFVGGPMDGTRAEVEGQIPPAMVVGETGGFFYRLSPDPDGLPNPAVLTYTYEPELSPAHDAVVQADREAIREVAEAEGLTVEQVLARARARKIKAKGAPSPIDLLTAEAQRLGVTVERLLADGFDLDELIVKHKEGASRDATTD